MPYIEKEDKKALDRSIAHLSTELLNGDFRGRFNYIISSIFSNMVQANGLSYRLINDYIGVLECAKLEAYRRIAVPYEDGKIVDKTITYIPAIYSIYNEILLNVRDQIVRLIQNKSDF